MSVEAGSATIHVIDDDRAFLLALERSLSALGERVATCTSAEDFLRQYRRHGPECLVADIRLPGMSGLELQATLLAEENHIPLVFITGHGDVAMAVTALKRGAIDFLEKPFRTHALLDAVELALERDRRNCALEADRAVIIDRLARLTPREREVLELVVDNRSAKDIAVRLRISPRTVEHHREHVMTKMSAATWHELYTMAVIGRVHELRLSPDRE